MSTRRHRILTAVISVGAFLFFGTEAEASLIGWWSFDASDGTDSSTFGNDGTLENNPGFSADVPVALGSGLSLSTDGTSRVSVPHSASLSVNDRVSVAFWMKASTASQVYAYTRAVSKIGGGRGWESQQRNAANTLEFRFDTSGGTNQRGGNLVTYDDAWHHLGLTLSNGSWATYLDGSLASSGSYNHGTGFANTSPLRIGTASNGTRGIVGLIDDVAVWDQAITEADFGRLASGIAPDLAVIPEPSAALLSGILFSFLGMLHRRKRRMSKLR